MLRFFHCKVLFRYVDFVFFALMMEIGFSNDERELLWMEKVAGTLQKIFYTLFGQCNFVLSPEENYSNIENCHS